MKKSSALGFCGSLLFSFLAQAAEPTIGCRVSYYHLEPWAESVGSVGQFSALGVAESTTPYSYFEETLRPGGLSCSDIALETAKTLSFPKYVMGVTVLMDISGKGHLVDWVKVDAMSKAGKKLSGDKRFYRPGHYFPKNCLPCFFFFTRESGEPTTTHPAGSKVVRNAQECIELGDRLLADLDQQGSTFEVGVAVVWGKGLRHDSERFLLADLK